MKELLRELSAGDKFGATIWNGLVRFVRSLRLIQGPGIKLTRTPNGTVVSVKPTKAAKGSTPVDNSCYAIEKIELHEEDPANTETTENEPANVDISFKNPYYRLNGKTFEGPGSIENLEIPVLLALKITKAGNEDEDDEDGETAEFSTFDDIDALKEEEENGESILIPLYSIGSNRSIEIDWRAMQDPSDDAAVDEVSIDKNGKKDENDPTGNLLEIAHFGDDEMDSSEGLVERIVADPESGKISAKGQDSLMILARKNGKLIYVPISGTGKDPEEALDPNESDPCEHDNVSDGRGGVSVEKDQGAVISSGDNPTGGGVLAGGDSHRGDDNCNSCNN